MEPYLYDNMALTEERHWWFRGRRAIVLDVIERLGIRDARILDVGAGTGATTVSLRRFGEVDALELAAEALAHLRKVPGLRTFETPLPAPEMPAESYDLVTAFDVLEHIPNDVEAIADIRRLLRPGGHFVCTVPAHPRLWTAHDEHHHHHRRYTRSSLRRALSDGGLEVSFCSPWLTVLFPMFLLDRALMRLRHPAHARAEVPVAPLNEALAALLGVERHWLARGMRLPFGASLIAVAHRP